MRYSCQEKLFTEEGQKKLSESKVCIVGAGALGSRSAELLCRAGIGRITLVDFDIVDEKNLHRQTLYDESDIGRFKTDAAKAHLNAINSEVVVETVNTALKDENAFLLSSDLVLDCTDHLDARRVIADHAKLWIHAALVRTTGTIVVMDSKEKYERLLGGKLAPESCSMNGVLPTLPSIVSAIQSAECIKILLGDEPEKRMIRLDGLTHRVDFYEI